MRPAWENMVARAKSKADKWEVAMGREPIFGPFAVPVVEYHGTFNPTYTLDNFPRDLRALVEGK